MKKRLFVLLMLLLLLCHTAYASESGESMGTQAENDKVLKAALFKVDVTPHGYRSAGRIFRRI